MARGLHRSRAPALKRVHMGTKDDHAGMYGTPNLGDASIGLRIQNPWEAVLLVVPAGRCNNDLQ